MAPNVVFIGLIFLNSVNCSFPNYETPWYPYYDAVQCPLGFVSCGNYCCPSYYSPTLASFAKYGGCATAWVCPEAQLKGKIRTKAKMEIEGDDEDECMHDENCPAKPYFPQKCCYDTKKDARICKNAVPLQYYLLNGK